MADARIKIKNARSEQLFLRVTEGQADAIRDFGEQLCEKNPALSYRWRNADGDINMSAVLREIITGWLPGWQQL